MNEMRVVLLFAGQGSQEVGMGCGLAQAYPVARALLERADGLLDFDLRKVMFEGPEEELTRTSRCQPALFVHGLMCLEVLRERCPELSVGAAAGLSLGEFTAHTAAGTFAFEDGLKLVARRGRFMEEACAETEGSMAALIGGTEAQVRALAGDAGLDIANLNAPGQIVVSGPREGIAQAVANARAAGIRMAKELNVAGAYHSRLMLPAQEKLARELAAIDVATPAFPVISNLTATPAATPEAIQHTLEAQVTGSVLWADSIQALIDQGYLTFLELGPGQVLTGLLGRIDKRATAYPIGTPERLESAVAALPRD